MNFRCNPSTCLKLILRIGEFNATAAGQQPAIQNRAVTQAARRTLLAAVAVGEETHATLDRADADLADAEVKAAAAERVAEIALAGAERLQREHATLAQKVAAIAPRTAPLVHAAAIELAHTRLGAYRAANDALSTAWAELMGPVLAADSFADTQAMPPRMYVSGLAYQPVFVALLPELQLDVKDWTFDSTMQVKAAHAAALRELGA